MSNRAKLYSAITMLIISLVLLGGASLAWFTISTNPEITGFQLSLSTDLDLYISKTGEEGSFTQSVTTDWGREDPLLVTDEDGNAILDGNGQPALAASIDNIPYYAAGLKPISTADGIHWFKPAYNSGDGSLMEAKYFPQADESINANVHFLEYSDDGTYSAVASDTAEYLERYNNAYYIYADIWLMTKNKDGVNVTLSTPDIVNDHDGTQRFNVLEKWEYGDGDSDFTDEEDEFTREHGDKYGTYVIEPSWDRSADDNRMESAFRVGFMEMNSDDGATGNFTIYEPNAFDRSDAMVKPSKDNAESSGDSTAYIVGYEVSGKRLTNNNWTDQNGNVVYGFEYSNYRNGYIETKPIGLGANNEPTTVRLDTSKLIVQDKSEYTTTHGNFSSWNLSTFGKFVKNTAQLYEVLDNSLNDVAIYDSSFPSRDLGSVEKALASDNMIVKLEYNTPKKIRLYFWVEGQDVDCWNDIATTEVVVNLEFAAQDIISPAD